VNASVDDGRGVHDAQALEAFVVERWAPGERRLHELACHRASDEARPPLEGVLVPLAASDDGRVLIMHEDEDAAGADPPWLRGLLRWGNIHVVR